MKMQTPLQWQFLGGKFSWRAFIFLQTPVQKTCMASWFVKASCSSGTVCRIMKLLPFLQLCRVHKVAVLNSYWWINFKGSQIKTLHTWGIHWFLMRTEDRHWAEILSVRPGWLKDVILPTQIHMNTYLYKHTHTPTDTHTHPPIRDICAWLDPIQYSKEKVQEREVSSVKAKGWTVSIH